MRFVGIMLKIMQVPGIFKQVIRPKVEACFRRGIFQMLS